MKALICELCGGNNIIKDDGYFVCQNCGTKYTLEEARKMMIEGTVNVQGTVTIDHSSDADNILKNADTTFATKNYKAAFELYSQALNIDPDNTHAILFRALCSGWQSSVKDCRIVEVDRASKFAIELQHKKYSDQKPYFDFCNDLAYNVSLLLNAISKMYLKYYDNAVSLNNGVAPRALELLHNGTNQCCKVSANVILNIISDVTDYSYSNDGLWNILRDMANNCLVYKCNAKMPKDPNDQKLVEKTNSIRAKAKYDISEKKAQTINDYWEKHSSEKDALESERTRLVSSISALENKRNNLPLCSTKIFIEQKINNLIKERNSLSFFKNKEKKEIQAQIDDEQAKLNEIIIKLEAPLLEIDSQIDSANNRIAEIDLELTKDRR